MVSTDSSRYDQIVKAVNLPVMNTQTISNSPDIYSILSITVLIISTLNTFFRPHTQLMENVNEMQKRA